MNGLLKSGNSSNTGDVLKDSLSPRSESIRCDVLKKIVQEFAEVIDEALLPQTTISSLGLRLALIMKQQFFEILEEQGDIARSEAFARAVVKFLSVEFGHVISSTVVTDEYVQLRIVKCPFKSMGSHSLCSIMQGIIGGFGLMSFGYCKISETHKFNDATKPCFKDVYLKQTPEIKNKLGVEYSKDSVVLLRGQEKELSIEHKRARRKLMLGLFSNLAFSLIDHSAEEVLVNNFISGLSNIPGIVAAALYLRASTPNEFYLVAQYGFPESTVPHIKRLRPDNKDQAHVKYIASPIEELGSKWEEALRDLSISALTTAKISSKDTTNGILTIGWSSPLAITPEISETLRAACTLLGAAIEGTQLYFELEKAHIDSISLINKLVGIVDKHANEHSKRVAELAESIAEEMGLPQDEVNLIYQAGIVHDIGKISISPDVLNKSDRLTADEFAMIKEHPRIGADLISPVSIFKRLVPAVLHHHERLDGSGYPEGLTGDVIPMYARIIAVADTFDAMTCCRAYRDARDRQEALDELLRDSGIKYDAAVVQAFIRTLEKNRAETITSFSLR